MSCTNKLTYLVANDGQVTWFNSNSVEATVYINPALAGFPLTVPANGQATATLTSLGSDVCYEIITECGDETTCTGLFDCDAADVVVNDGNPVQCPSTVPIELNWIDCNGDRVTTGFQGLDTDLGDCNFIQDLGNGRNLYTWNVFGGSTTSPNVANFTYGDPNDLCTFSVDVAACEESDKRIALLNDPNRCGYGANATGGTNEVRVKTIAELEAAINVPNSYVILDESLAGQTLFTSDFIVSNADNITVDGSCAPGVTFELPYSANNGVSIFRFFGDNLILHDFTVKGNDFNNTSKSHAAIVAYGSDIWIDKITGSGFNNDFIDLVIAVDNITVSRAKSFNTDKSVFVWNTQNPRTKLTVHSSDLNSNQRSPWMSAGFAHVFNNYIHDGGDGSVAGRSAAQWISFTHTADSLMISQENIYENQQFHALNGQSNVTATQGNEGFIQSVNNIITGTGTSGNVTNSSSPTLFNIPYDCSDILKPASQVKSYVQSVAGAS